MILEYIIILSGQGKKIYSCQIDKSSPTMKAFLYNKNNWTRLVPFTRGYRFFSFRLSIRQAGYSCIKAKLTHKYVD